jgi:hypothetical protein
MPDSDTGDLFVAPKIIADRGGGVFLIDIGNGKGQIAETKIGMLFKPRNVEAILARGYWQSCDDVDAANVLALVTATTGR